MYPVQWPLHSNINKYKPCSCNRNLHNVHYTPEFWDGTAIYGSSDPDEPAAENPLAATILWASVWTTDDLLTCLTLLHSTYNIQTHEGSSALQTHEGRYEWYWVNNTHTRHNAVHKSTSLQPGKTNKYINNIHFKDWTHFILKDNNNNEKYNNIQCKIQQ